MIVIEVNSNLAIPAELDTIEITTTSNGHSQAQSFPVTQASGLPKQVGAVKAADGAKTMEVVAKALVGGKPVVSETAILTFVEGKSMVFRMYLAAECRINPCPAEKVCTKGAVCLDKARPVSDLVPWPSGTAQEDAGTMTSPIDANPSDGNSPILLDAGWETERRDEGVDSVDVGVADEVNRPETQPDTPTETERPAPPDTAPDTAADTASDKPQPPVDTAPDTNLPETPSDTAGSVFLSLTKSGAGGGTITSSPMGINCGTTCSAAFAAGELVTLSASAGGTSVFKGWSGACTGTSSCVITMDVAKAVTATFDILQDGLNVAKSGTGSGTVVSSPAGINCGAACSANFTTGATIVLTATPDASSVFSGWSGACTATGTCTVALSSAKSVTAIFDAQYALTVAKTGAGTGTVTSQPSGLSCGSDCSVSYLSGTQVTLTATPGNLSIFTGWSGECSGTGTCTVVMSAARSVTATFESQYVLTVSKAGVGSGMVSSSPAGIACGSTCSAAFNNGTQVTLTASAASGSTLAGWSGACTGTGACVVSANAAKSVTATFLPTTIEIQPGPNTAMDSQVIFAMNHAVGSHGNENFGRFSAISVGVYDENTLARALMRFELPAGLSANKVASAQLILQVVGWTPKHIDGPLSVYVHKALKSWKQGNAVDNYTVNSPTVDGVTAVERFWGASWSTVGVGLDDVDASSASTATVTKTYNMNAVDNSPWTFDVTSYAKDWAASPAANLGFLLRSNEYLVYNPGNSTWETYSYPQFHAGEAADATMRPKLVLTLSP